MGSYHKLNVNERRGGFWEKSVPTSSKTVVTNGYDGARRSNGVTNGYDGARRSNGVTNGYDGARRSNGKKQTSSSAGGEWDTEKRSGAKKGHRGRKRWYKKSLWRDPDPEPVVVKNKDPYEDEEVAGFNRWTTYKYPTLSLVPLPGQKHVFDWNMKIPRRPPYYDPDYLTRLRQSYQQDYEEPEPEVSPEEHNARLIEGLRYRMTFESQPIKKSEYPRTRVHVHGITPKGTVRLSFIDSKNEAHYNSLAKRLRICAGAYKTIGLDSKILMEDVKKGLIVRVYHDEKERWLRARVEDFGEDWIQIDCVDEKFTAKLTPEKVHYMHWTLGDCPFQIQECYFLGLEEWENSERWEHFYYHLKSLARARRLVHRLENFEEEFEEDSDDESDSDDEEEPEPELGECEFDFWVTEVQQEGTGKPYIKLDFPDEIGEGISVNDWLKFQLEHFYEGRDCLLVGEKKF